MVRVAKVDCTDKARGGGGELCTDFKIRGVPTVYFFAPGEEGFYKYSGERSVQGLEDWYEGRMWLSM